MTDSYIISTRLNLIQKKKLTGIAKSKGISTSLLLKHIIVSYLDEKEDIIESNAMLQMQLIDVKKEVQKIGVNQEWFEQLFYTWLENWFLSHPKIDESNAINLAKTARLRRDKFVDIFNTQLYNENKTLYDTLIANSIEENNDN